MVAERSEENSGRYVPGVGIVKYLLRRRRYAVMLVACVLAFVLIGEMLDGTGVSELKNSKAKVSAAFEGMDIPKPRKHERHEHIIPKTPDIIIEVWE